MAFSEEEIEEALLECDVLREFYMIASIFDINMNELAKEVKEHFKLLLKKDEAERERFAYPPPDPPGLLNSCQSQIIYSSEIALLQMEYRKLFGHKRDLSNIPHDVVIADMLRKEIEDKRKEVEGGLYGEREEANTA